MNILWLYIICIGMLFLVLATGYIVSGNCSKILNSNTNISNSNDITGKELTETLINKNSLLNINITNLNAKKTNYYSLKYNVIKVAPEINNSTSLTALAISSNLANDARLGQKRTLIYCLKLIVSFISKLCSIIFVPTVLICAIINASTTSNIPSIIIWITLILYASSLASKLTILCFEFISINKLTKDLESLRLFNKDEITTLKSLLHSLSRLDFWNYTIKSIAFFNLASPNLISGNTNY